jgi:hypothetical protein
MHCFNALFQIQTALKLHGNWNSPPLLYNTCVLLMATCKNQSSYACSVSPSIQKSNVLSEKYGGKGHSGLQKHWVMKYKENENIRCSLPSKLHVWGILTSQVHPLRRPSGNVTCKTSAALQYRSMQYLLGMLTRGHAK